MEDDGIRRAVVPEDDEQAFDARPALGRFFAAERDVTLFGSAIAVYGAEYDAIGDADIDL